MTKRPSKSKPLEESKLGKSSVQVPVHKLAITGRTNNQSYENSLTGRRVVVTITDVGKRFKKPSDTMNPLQSRIKAKQFESATLFIHVYYICIEYSPSPKTRPRNGKFLSIALLVQDRGSEVSLGDGLGGIGRCCARCGRLETFLGDITNSSERKRSVRD